MKKFLFIFISVVILSPLAFSQHEVDSADIKWTVPELFEFHDVIYLIWHEAYPAKDIKALVSYTDKIKEGIAKINSATLPGILRDKEAKWNEGLRQLNASAEAYYNAAGGTDDQVMLDAAEKLHSDFEMMVRIIKPVAKEVDEFHKVLYVIYHRYYPEKDYASLSSVIDELIAKAEACVSVKLSKRLESKSEEYVKTANELVELTKALKTALATDDPKNIENAVEKMHSKYQDLEKVFD